MKRLLAILLLLAFPAFGQGDEGSARTDPLVPLALRNSHALSATTPTARTDYRVLDVEWVSTLALRHGFHSRRDGWPMVATAFLLPVPCVDGWIPKEQVVRPHARRIVAAVENLESIGNQSKVEFPRDAMGKSHLTITPELTVASADTGAPPLPALIGLEDFVPEAYFEGWPWGHVKAPQVKPMSAGGRLAVLPEPTLTRQPATMIPQETVA